MAKIQAVWALDIGQAALKALKLVPGDAPDQVIAEAFDFVEYPKILSQPDADPEQLVREALATFLDRNDLKGCKVSIAVPGQAGLVKFIKLPPVEKKRIPDIVKFEAKQQIPFALSEVVWDYQQIGDEEEGGDEDFAMAEVGLFAMKRDQINRAILPFKNAGIEVDFVQMSPIALYNFITFDKIKGSDSKDSVVLLDIGADNTDLIITDGVRIWQRNVPIGGNHFTRALTKELKQTFAKAEHLKRNATKAPDPRSIFAAMRGVFNDFASEVNRSIGFFSSVNRSSKISKVVGMGNGFKLPGLQKFLQQNLGQEVEKLDSFARLVGDEVTAQPVFQDNAMSFAVAYGLALQGLGKSALRTNLLPPEITQVRLVRAKKPWVLAAAALLMLGFGAMFLGEYRALAKVISPRFQTAAAEATNVAKRGADFNSEFETAKTAFEEKKTEGEALVGSAAQRGLWPEFLKNLSTFLPDPVREKNLDPNVPADVIRLEKLRVHIDAIKPVWREEVGEEWFNAPPPTGPTDTAKNLMHPYDRANAPSGPGWVIQVVGHHYNPYPKGSDELKLPDAQRTAYGPYGYLVSKVIPSLLNPKARLYGVKSVMLAWMTSDKEWTTEKGAQTNGLASNTVPLMARATPPVAAVGEEGGMMGGMMGQMMGQMGGGGRGMPGDMAGMMGQMGGQMGGMMGGRGMMGEMDMMGMMGQGRGMMGGNPASKRKLTTLTRTDFLIQFVWQPPTDEEKPKTPEEIKEKLAELTKNLMEAQKETAVVTITDSSELEAASLAQSKKVETELQKVETEMQSALKKAVEKAAPAGAAPAGAAPAAAPGAVPPQ